MEEELATESPDETERSSAPAAVEAGPDDLLSAQDPRLTESMRETIAAWQEEEQAERLRRVEDFSRQEAIDRVDRMAERIADQAPILPHQLTALEEAFVEHSVAVYRIKQQMEDLEVSSREGKALLREVYRERRDKLNTILTPQQQDALEADRKARLKAKQKKAKKNKSSGKK